MATENEDTNENLIGIALMTTGMAAGASVDALVKAASKYASPSQIAVLFGFGVLITCVVPAKRRGLVLRSRAIFQRMVLVRTILEVVSVFGIILALGLVPLTTMTVLIQSVPLIVMAGAVLFMGERARLIDWLVLIFGFIGVILIIRPGYAGFEPMTLVALVAVVALAGRDLASRAVPHNVSTAQLGVWGGGALGITGLTLSVILSQPLPVFSLATALHALAIVLFAGITFYGITAAMRLGNIATVSPFRYTRLVFGILLGLVFFEEKLTPFTIAGAALIISAGLYSLRKELRSKKCQGSANEQK